MTIHGTGFVFFVTLAFFFGMLCQYDIEKKDGNTLAVMPVIVAALALLVTFITLISRGLGL